MLLGTFGETDNDFPWRHGTFDPSPAFAGYQHLFNSLHECLEAELGADRHTDQFWVAWRAVRNLKLRFEESLTGRSTEPVMLILSPGGQARFRQLDPPDTWK